MAGTPHAAELLAKIAAQHPNAYLVEKERLAGRPVDFVRPKPALVVLATIALDPAQPYVIERAPDRTQYAALEAQFKTLFGIGP